MPLALNVFIHASMLLDVEIQKIFCYIQVGLHSLTFLSAIIAYLMLLKLFIFDYDQYFGLCYNSELN